MIRFEHVTHQYGPGQPALRDVSLRFERGEFAFITGRSGAGKSTLLKLLYAAERPTRGDVLIEAKSIARLHPKSVPYLRRNLGIVFQDFKLLPRRSVRDNVALALQVRGLRRREVAERTATMLERVGLAAKADRRPGELSGGEQQRAAIARALVGRPSIVLADEPTGNLDEGLSADIIDLLYELSREEEATVLVATHDALLLERVPARRVRLEAGAVIDSGDGRRDVEVVLPPPDLLDISGVVDAEEIEGSEDEPVEEAGEPGDAEDEPGDAGDEPGDAEDEPGEPEALEEPPEPAAADAVPEEVDETLPAEADTSDEVAAALARLADVVGDDSEASLDDLPDPDSTSTMAAVAPARVREQQDPEEDAEAEGGEDRPLDEEAAIQPRAERPAPADAPTAPTEPSA